MKFLRRSEVRSIRRCMDEDLEVVKDVWNVL